MKLGSRRIVKKLYIFPRKFNKGSMRPVWAWGRCRIRQELQEKADDWYMYKLWVDIEKLD